MSRKSTKAEMEKREREILELLSQGFSRGDIGERLAPKYNCTPLAITKQYDKVVKNLRITDEGEKENARAVNLQRFEFLYQQAVREGQKKVAADIIEKHGKLLGLYERGAQKEEVPQIFIQGKPDLAVVPKEKDAKEK